MHLLLTQKFTFGVLSNSNYQYTVNLGQYENYVTVNFRPLPLMSSKQRHCQSLLSASVADFGRDLPTPLPTRLPSYSMYFLNKQNTVTRCSQKL